MSAPHPATPVAEDIDEPAARRSIRFSLIVVGAALLLPMLGFLVYRQLGHQPAGVHHSTSVWPLVISLAVLGIMVVAMGLAMRRQHRRPDYRRVMQYGWRQRARVGKDLRRGRVLSAVDMPVAAAMVGRMRSQRRLLVIVLGLQPIIWLSNGVIQHGFLRWLDLGLAASWIVYLPYLLHQQRQMIRNFERQNTPAIGDQQDDAGTAG